MTYEAPDLEGVEHLPPLYVPAYDKGYPEPQPPLYDEDQLEVKETPTS